MSPVGKTLISGTVVKVKVRIRFKQVVVMVRVRVSLQEINVSLYKL